MTAAATLQKVPLTAVVELREASIDSLKGELTLTVIESGLNTSQTVFYPGTVLERDHSIFDGAKMFLNHPTFSEEFERPEGDLNNWVANLVETWWDSERAAVRGRAQIVDPAFKEKAALLAETGQLLTLGVSIRAFGKGEKETMEGVEGKVLVIEELTAARSVDFVTFAGAGGVVELLESDKGIEETEVTSPTELREEKRPNPVEAPEQGGGRMDLTELTAAEIREQRPDLVAELQEAQSDADIVKMHRQQIADLRKDLREASERASREKELRESSEKESENLRTQLREAEKRERKIDVARRLEEAINAVDDLPKPVAERIRARFKDSETLDGITEAIRVERDYLRELRNAGVVRDIGLDEEEPEKVREGDLKGVFQRLGFTPEASEVAAGGRF